MKDMPGPLLRERLRLWLKLLKASGLVEEEIRRRLRRDLNWTLPRFDVMSALAQAPEGLRMSEISRRLRVSNGNVTGIVDKLVEEALAERFADPDDRRAHLIVLTEKGHKLFARHVTVHHAWIDEIFGGLDADDLAGMIDRLDHLTQSLEARDHAQ